MNLKTASETFEQGLLYHQDTFIFIGNLCIYYVPLPCSLITEHSIMQLYHIDALCMYNHCSDSNLSVSIHNFSVMHNI